MREVKHKVVVIGCGWMGEQYVEAYTAKVSAASGNVPIRLPLEDRSLTLYPNKQRWLGQDTIDT